MPTVLIVDDDHAMRSALEILLKCKSYGVVLAPESLTGIRLFGSVSFDAVVVDMLMPGMNGIATIRELIQIDATVRSSHFAGLRRQSCRDRARESFVYYVILRTAAERPCS